MATRTSEKRVKGLGGFLDRRSQADSISISNFTLVLNSSLRGRNKRCRRGGWRKLLDGVAETYNNEDLHDQLIGLSFYYEPLSESIVILGGISGYAYPFFFPGINNPGGVSWESVGSVCAYAPDFFGLYDFPPLDGLGILDYVVGFPYLYDPDGYPYDPCAQSGYTGSSFTLVDATYTYSEFVAGYGYGDLVPVYQATEAYLYEYCGNYAYPRGGCREPITFTMSFGSAEGKRTLLAATRTRIYSLNQSTGNWRIVADGLGSPPFRATDCTECTNERWMGANLENVVILTNGVNRVMAYSPNLSPTGCNVWRTGEIGDLITLNVLSAGVVGSWKTFAFLGDTFQDGARRRNRIMWSNSGDPYSWISADDTLAGFQDLGTDDTILRIEGLNDFLFVYTDRSIYRGALVDIGGTATFVFEEIFREDWGALKYKFSLVNAGDAHYYWSKDRLCKMTSWDKRPQEPVVLRLVSNSVFDGVIEDHLKFGPLNEEFCNQFVGGFNSTHKEVWFSWPTDNRSTVGTDGLAHSCPNMSMVINITPGEEGVDFVDAGFTAFHWFDGRSSKTLFEFLEDIQVCPRESLLDKFVKEGLPYETESAPFDNPVLHIWNADEDITQPASSDSLCAALTETWLRDICGDCNAVTRFVMASSEDKTLKEYADKSYYRETLDGDAYVMDGYSTVIQSGLEDFGTDDEKQVNRLTCSVTSELQTTPNLLYAFIAYGPAADCIRWKQLKVYDQDCDTLSEGIELRCLTEYTSQAAQEADHVRPDDYTSWPTCLRGRMLGWRLLVNGTGGGSCYSKAAMEVKVV